MPLILILMMAFPITLPDSESPPVQQEQAVPIVFEPADRALYILGPGDELEIILEGGATPASLAAGLLPQSICTVASDGVLSLSGLGQVTVGGLTIDEAQLELTRISRYFYPGTTIGISLSFPRLVRIRASGAVAEPGIYPMYSLQNVSDLLMMCGSVPLCSRTGWMYTGSDSTWFDLRIDPRTHFPVADPLLAESATVFFQACTDPVYVFILVGDPQHSSIQAWQIDEPMELPLFIDLIGASGSDFRSERSEIVREGVTLAVWDGDELSDLKVLPGDSLFLSELRSLVTISGAVAMPGDHEWIAGLRAVDYVRMAGGPLVDANTGSLRLIRAGETIERGSSASDAIPIPGDIVEVPFSWSSRSSRFFSILGTIVSTAAIIITLSIK